MYGQLSKRRHPETKSKTSSAPPVSIFRFAGPIPPIGINLAVVRWSADNAIRRGV